MEESKIKVVVRKRPISKKELSKGEIDVISVLPPSSVHVKEPKQKVDLTKYTEEHEFQFDLAFGEEAQNQEIYTKCVYPLVEAAFNEYKTTCFAYGQTGSGKTFTMLGQSLDVNPGLFLLASFDVFDLLAKHPQLTVHLSFYEIYCGKLFDLLNERNLLQAREDAKANVNIVGLTQK
jgi:kinesin family protein 2/24